MEYRTRHKAQTYELRAKILRRLESIPGGMASYRIKKEVAKEFGIGWQRLYDIIGLKDHRTHKLKKKRDSDQAIERIATEEESGYRPTAKNNLPNNNQ